MNRLLKILFFAVIVRPITLIALGLNIRNLSGLPRNGPAIIIANHNSHLDTLVLMSLYPLSRIHKIRPVAAADYFLKNALYRWFFLKVIGIIPLSRTGFRQAEELFSPCYHALDNNDILILFPEGTRGDPEQRGRLKKGIYHLIKPRAETPLIPIIMHGLGRALPRGELLLVPFNCDVVIGDPVPPADSAEALLEKIETINQELLSKCLTYTHVKHDK